MSDTITLTGVVATAPSTLRTDSGVIITTFRLASNQRRFDKTSQGWIDGESNFYTISAFRQTAQNVLTSLSKGDRVMVTGRLKVRNWTSGERRGIAVDVEADALGHDLAWGTTQLNKVSRSSEPDAVVSEDRFAPVPDGRDSRENHGDGAVAADEAGNTGEVQRDAPVPTFSDREPDRSDLASAATPF